MAVHVGQTRCQIIPGTINEMIRFYTGNFILLEVDPDNPSLSDE
jgi:hypothetical protein